MDVDELYGLALDRFIPGRASLVRELRSAGEREQAATVAALRKPSVAAWAVNQLVRTQRRDVDELFAVGDALREVQAGVLAGSADARDLRSAADHEREAVDDLVATARGLLSSGGHELSAITLERVSETLHAAALDDEARGEVSEGRLVRELRHVGLGGGLGGAVAAPATRPASQDRRATKDRRTTQGRQAGQDRQAVKERKAAETAQRREREAARKEARALERDAVREIDRAQRALRAAQDREARAHQALQEAEAGVSDAEAGVDAAVAAHRQAKQRLDAIQQ
ncbi:MAG TPA: hypothetical protein VGF68_08405 [Solirubrobacteraceae bacterium]